LRYTGFCPEGVEGLSGPAKASFPCNSAIRRVVNRRASLVTSWPKAYTSCAWGSVNNPAIAASIKARLRASLFDAVSMPCKLATRVPNRFAQDKIPADG
jgi:hypothetical protein